jgi:hypothetical protein
VIELDADVPRRASLLGVLGWLVGGFVAVIVGVLWWVLLHGIGLPDLAASLLTLLFALVVFWLATAEHWAYGLAAVSGALAVWPAFWLWFFWVWSHN